MKDLLATDRFGFERIVMQLLIPGLIAIGPLLWLLYLLHRPDVLQIMGSEGPIWLKNVLLVDDPSRPKPLFTFIQNNKGLAAFVVLVFAVVAGLIIEDMGSWVEWNVIDKWNTTNKDRNLFFVWDSYLRLLEDNTKTTAVLADYTSTIMPRMKFQLSTSISLLFFAGGMTVVYICGLLRLGHVVYWSIMPLTLFVAILEYRKALSYCALLHRNRVLMLQARSVLPPDYLAPVLPGAGITAPQYLSFKHSPSCCTAKWKLQKLAENNGYTLCKVVKRSEMNGMHFLRMVVNLPSWPFYGACPHFRSDTLVYLHPTLLVEE